MAALSRLADETLAAAYRIALGRPAEPAPPTAPRGRRDGQVRRRRAQLRVRCGRHLRRGRPTRTSPAGTAVAARLMEICGQVAWPVDAALRPEGSRGPLVRTLASHQAYYRSGRGPGSSRRCSRPGRRPATSALGQDGSTRCAPLVWHAAERPEAVDDVRAMRRRIIESVPPRRGRPGDQARAGRPARHRVRGTAAAARARPRRRDAARHRPRWTALRALIAGGYVGRDDGEALPQATASCAASSTGCSCSACAAPTPCPTTRPRCAGSRARSATAPTPRPGRGRGVPGRLGHARRARSAGCTPSCSTGRCSRRWPGCRPRRCG